MLKTWNVVDRGVLHSAIRDGTRLQLSLDAEREMLQTLSKLRQVCRCVKVIFNSTRSGEEGSSLRYASSLPFGIAVHLDTGTGHICDFDAVYHFDVDILLEAYEKTVYQSDHSILEPLDWSRKIFVEMMHMLILTRTVASSLDPLTENHLSIVFNVFTL